MYWKAAKIKYKREDRTRVGILLFYTQSPEEKPVMYILGALLKGNGVKRKWRKPMKIKRWLLYDHHSYSYATRFPERTIFKDEFKFTEVGEMNKLWPFDKEIIKKKFPSVTRYIFREVKKKRK